MGLYMSAVLSDNSYSVGWIRPCVPGLYFRGFQLSCQLGLLPFILIGLMLFGVSIQKNVENQLERS